MQLKEIGYALSNLYKRSIFKANVKAAQIMGNHSNSLLMIDKNDFKGRPGRMSMRLQWIKEFSDIGSEISNIDLLREAKASSGHLQYHRASIGG